MAYNHEIDLILTSEGWIFILGGLGEVWSWSEARSLSALSKIRICEN